MLTTSTHDTKRSEDVRARLALLSEVPEQWAEASRRWTDHNERFRRDDAPERAAEYLLYQTLVGAWPIEEARVAAYMEKATREAKTRTAWTRIDAAYEEGVRAFIAAVLADAWFRSDLEGFVAPLVLPGRVNGLAQTLLKLAAPGVPDIYQGTELWDLSLVDPDNRRPIDFELRQRLLADLDGMGVDEVMARMDEGLPKLWLIRGALALRGRRPELFGPEGAYRPLLAAGTKARHAVAFARGDGAIAVAPRLVIGLGGDWADTTLAIPPGAWRNVLTGESVRGGRVRLGHLLARFPVALLEREA